ncbi:putative ferric-chelate reductase 1 isoform X2 [Babylonia areolata]|uniref:putative ferric-chelate reductase 1 isoform X2 n=1 Tax=Babylonia areolata TaxID=304850 RepID=UPI003FD667DB
MKFKTACHCCSSSFSLSSSSSSSSSPSSSSPPSAPSLSSSLTMLTVLALTALLWSGAEGYSRGAPFSTCLTMFPKHGPTQRQVGPAPFRLDLRPLTYRPGRVITVDLLSNDLRPIKGVQVKAVRSSGDSETVLGSFVQTPPNITQVFTCEGGFKNMVTHTKAMRDEHVNKVTLTWKAPDTNVGDILFVASVVEDYQTFWTGVNATLTSELPLAADPPLVKLPGVNVQKENGTGLERCGEDRGCFLYPRFCSGPDCQAAVSFRQDGADADHFRFELMAKKADYVSVGFSEDVMMGEDETISCTGDGEILTVQHGFNPKLYNQRIVRHQLSDLRVNRTDGHVSCSFRRPRVTVTRYANQSASELQYVSTTYDLDKEYYLMLAWGTVKKGSDVMNKHKELPPVTDSKVSFRNNAIYRGSALPVEARIHGSLMAVAWVLVAGLTTAMSRYYKHWLSNRVFCGTSLWFQVHRAAAITVGVLTGSGVILIFVKIGDFSKEYRHAIRAGVPLPAPLQVVPHGHGHQRPHPLGGGHVPGAGHTLHPGGDARVRHHGADGLGSRADRMDHRAGAAPLLHRAAGGEEGEGAVDGGAEISRHPAALLLLPDAPAASGRNS